MEIVITLTKYNTRKQREEVPAASGDYLAKLPPSQ